MSRRRGWSSSWRGCPGDTHSDENRRKTSRQNHPSLGRDQCVFHLLTHTHTPIQRTIPCASCHSEYSRTKTECLEKAGQDRQVHQRQRTEMERERALDGVLPDAKLHPRALHPLTCTLSLSLVIPAFTLHRDLMCASLQPQQDASAAHITASMSTETPRPETTTASGSPAAHNDERATMKNRVIIVS